MLGAMSGSPESTPQLNLPKGAGSRNGALSAQFWGPGRGECGHTSAGVLCSPTMASARSSLQGRRMGGHSLGTRLRGQFSLF